MDKKRIVLGLSIAVVIMTALLFVPAGSWVALPVLLAVCWLAMREMVLSITICIWSSKTLKRLWCKENYQIFFYRFWSVETIA